MPIQDQIVTEAMVFLKRQIYGIVVLDFADIFG